MRVQAKAAYVRAFFTSLCAFALLTWFGIGALDRPLVEAWRVPAVIVTASLTLKIHFLRRHSN